MKKKSVVEWDGYVLPMFLLSLFVITASASLTTAWGGKQSLQEGLFNKIKAGEIDSVEDLLSTTSVNLQDTDEGGSTALHCAALFNRVDIANLLIKRGALVNAPNRKDGSTPLHDAVYEGHIAMVKLLIDHNANVTLQNYQGYAPIHEVQQKFKSPFYESQRVSIVAILELLLQRRVPLLQEGGEAGERLPLRYTEKKKKENKEKEPGSVKAVSSSSQDEDEFFKAIIYGESRTRARGLVHTGVDKDTQDKDSFMSLHKKHTK